MFRVPVPVRLPCVLFLDPAGIGQHEPAQIHRPRCAVHPPLVAIGPQTREIAHVIQVCVGQDHGVDLARRHRKFRPIAKAQFLQPLEQTAVHEHPLPGVLEQVFRPGHGAGGAKKRQISHK